jgi:serine/threonine protein kinase
MSLASDPERSQDRSSDEKPILTRCGELLGDTYLLVSRIGAGGMGEVYAAQHRRLERQFAVKVLRAGGDPKAADRFRREARAIARVENEFVVSVVDFGAAADGTPYIVMDLLRGVDLRALLEQAAPLPIPRAVSLVSDACHGVAALHQAGLVHRDLKPANLFVTKRATGEDWCKILDLGVAKMDASISTVDGALIGTVKYMAPEQLRDGASAGAPVDIYALGAILYECLSGDPPHSGASVQELMFKVMNEEPPRLDQLRPEIPAALATAVKHALAKRADQRFATVQAFQKAIAPFSSSRGEPRAVPDSDQTVDLESAVDAAVLAPKKRALGMPLVGVALIAAAVWGVRSSGVSASAHPSAVAALAVPVHSIGPTSGSASTAPVALPPLVMSATAIAAPPTPSLATSAHAPAVPLARRMPVNASSEKHSVLSLPKPRFDVSNPYAQ